MKPFAFSDEALDPGRGRLALADASAGGFASFEGWVRDHNDGRRVRRLEYEAFVELAVKEGERIVAEAIERFGVGQAACVHRVGALELGELAVWVGVSAAHRAEAFAACRYIIDEVKHRVPIWKKEHYEDGDSGWVNCERCAAGASEAGQHAEHAHGGEHRHADAAPGDYSRQIALPEVGVEGQRRIGAASVLVIGAGGLGVPVLQYLAAAGVGRIGIVDGDRVEASNLHRQPLYARADVGRLKAVVAAERLADLNPALRIEVIAEAATDANVDRLVADHDLVVECTDNFRSKFLINDAVVRAQRPAVFASVYQYEGQLQVYRPRPDWPCMRCIWPQAPIDGLVGNCAEAGVLGPVPAALGALQAMEALKLILGLDSAARPSLRIFDFSSLQLHALQTARDPRCAHDAAGARAAAPPAAITPAAIECEFSSLAEARSAGFELLDIREAWERSLDPPDLDPGQHLPLSEWLDGRAQLTPGPRYLIVCAHGVRSLALTQRLHELGFEAARSLRGGLAGLGIGR